MASVGLGLSGEHPGSVFEMDYAPCMPAASRGKNFLAGRNLYL